MVRGAAKRKRQAERGELRKKHIEVPDIFGGEIAREPTRLGVDAQARLHAGEVSPA
jgi:hypothetical protein